MPRHPSPNRVVSCGKKFAGISEALLEWLRKTYSGDIGKNNPRVLTEVDLLWPTSRAPPTLEVMACLDPWNTSALKQTQPTARIRLII